MDRRGRVRVFALMLALSASLIPMASAYALISVTQATGGNAISVDTFGTGTYTTLTGPSIKENLAGDVGLGRIDLDLPAGFQYNTAVGNVTVSGGAGCPTVGPITVGATTASVNITAVSSVPNCVISFVGLQVRPTSGALVSGNLTESGTAAGLPSPGNYGTLTTVPGAPASITWVQQPSPNTNGGVAFGNQPVVRVFDQFGNGVQNPIVNLAIVPGTGAAGAILTCNTNPVTGNIGGFAVFAGCKIDKAGTYNLRASVGSVFADSGAFVIAVGPANKLVFTSYPATSTAPLLTPQPAVAITDAGGNVITTDTRMVTLAINKNSGTFSCTGGLSIAAVAGVATFTGCTQSAADTGYMLTATSTTPQPSVNGPLFAVAPATLAFIAGPGAPVAAGMPFPTNIQVAIQNGGVTQTSGIAATVTLAIGTNPGGGTLTCTGGNAVGTINGVATFTGCSINNAGSGYTLVATASNVVPATTIGPATSAPFNVGTATPASILLSVLCSAPNAACPVDATKTPPQANIKLPQSLSEGITLAVSMGASGANRPVTFQFSKDQVTWTDIILVNTDGAGNASTFYRPPDNRYYRAVFAGAGDLGAATSNVIRVVVRQLVFLRPTGCTNSASPCRRSDDTTIRFAAIARPNKPELPTQQAVFTIERRVGSTWTPVTTQTVAVSKSSGEAGLDVTFNQPGTYRLRANLLPTSVNANSFPTPFEYYRIT